MLSWLYCVVVLSKIYVFGLFWVYSLASTQCSGQTSVSSPKNQGLIYEVSAKEIIMQTMWGHRFSIQTGRSRCRHSDIQPHPVICMNCWIVNPCIFCIDFRVHEVIEFCASINMWWHCSSMSVSHCLYLNLNDQKTSHYYWCIPDMLGTHTIPN